MSDGGSEAPKENMIKNALKWFDKARNKVKPEELEEDIMLMINEGHESGALEDDEVEMISNIFALNDKEASDIMTHRSQIVALDGNASLEEALDFVLDENFSRFPVFTENFDHILGILHLKDAFRLHRNPSNLSKALKDIPGLVREAYYVTETKKIDTLFQEMQKKKIQMSIVIDEYGQTVGLIALEDILEEIVGNIQDEYDEEENYIQKQDDDHFVIDGMSLLEQLEERFQIDFEENDFETLNGFMISKMDRIPEEKDDFSIIVGGYEFRIMEVKMHRIEKVLVTKMQNN